MKNSTLIVLIVDKSGSMMRLKDDTIGGINSLITDNRTTENEVLFSLYTFSSEGMIDRICTMKNINEVALLGPGDYCPTGGTALHSAMCRIIDEVGYGLASLPEHERPNKILVTTITDGEENDSRMYNASHVKERITHQTEKYSWVFSYLGANQDAITNASRMGININNSVTYTLNNFSDAVGSISKRARGMTLCKSSVDAADMMSYSSVERESLVSK